MNTVNMRFCKACKFCEFVLISCLPSTGLCQPRIPGTVGAEPFSAKIRYTGPDDPDYPNLIKLTVTMPHMDGKQLSQITQQNLNIKLNFKIGQDIL